MTEKERMLAGNPCKVIRPITRADRDRWQALADEYWREHE